MEKAAMQQEQHFEDEIDLMDILRVLWKRKILIVSGVFLLTTAAVGVSLLLPSIYEVTAIVEPGKRPISNQAGQIIDEKVVESPEAIKEAVLGGAFDVNVQTKLHIQAEDYPEIKVVVPKNTELVKLSIESSDPQQAKSVLEEIVAMISNDVEGKVEQERMQVRNDIKKAMVDYHGIIEQVKLLEAQISETTLTIKNLESDRNKAMAARTTDAMAVLLYSNEIQNNRIYLNSLNMKHKDSEMQSQIAGINAENQQIRLDGVKATKVHKAPTIYPEPVKPRKKIIVALAFFGAVMVMTLMAFILENIQRRKKVGPEC